MSSILKSLFFNSPCNWSGYYSSGWTSRSPGKRLSVPESGKNAYPWPGEYNPVLSASREKVQELVADYLPALLSCGEQQRLAIARALANRPKLILADEPTASLDTERGKKVMGMLKRIAQENQTAVITVTHDDRMIEGFGCIYHLKDGRMDQNHS
jgi:ATPase subunit of ABC transporter with duplicated ATPase domains